MYSEIAERLLKPLELNLFKVGNGNFITAIDGDD
jgi:hypothetical protein